MEQIDSNKKMNQIQKQFANDVTKKPDSIKFYVELLTDRNYSEKESKQNRRETMTDAHPNKKNK